MRLARWQNENGDAFGCVTADKKLVDLTGVFGWQIPDVKSLIGAELPEADLARKEKGRLGAAMVGTRWLPPVENPGKIICVGVNYPERNAEYKDGSDQPKFPSLFVRFPSTFVGHEQPILRPRESEQFDYEGEIVLVIGKPGRRIAEADALEHVFGVTLMNDGSVRDWIRHGKFNVTQGKNFEKSGSIGPWIVTRDAAGDLNDLTVITRVNGEERQRGNTGTLLFPIARIIAYVSTFITLEPGDLIATGTPPGSGARFEPPKWLKPGDVVEVECPQIGVLRNTVADEPAGA